MPLISIVLATEIDQLLLKEDIHIFLSNFPAEIEKPSPMRTVQHLINLSSAVLNELLEAADYMISPSEFRSDANQINEFLSILSRASIMKVTLTPSEVLQEKLLFLSQLAQQIEARLAQLQHDITYAPTDPFRLPAVLFASDVLSLSKLNTQCSHASPSHTSGSIDSKTMTASPYSVSSKESTSECSVNICGTP